MLLILICVCVGVFQPGQLQQHAFKSKALKRAKPCHLCHQPVLLQASCCRGKTKNMFIAFSLSLCGARTKITTWGKMKLWFISMHHSTVRIYLLYHRHMFCVHSIEENVVGAHIGFIELVVTSIFL
jgi:hypothetical protein